MPRRPIFVLFAMPRASEVRAVVRCCRICGDEVVVPPEFQYLCIVSSGTAPPADATEWVCNFCESFRRLWRASHRLRFALQGLIIRLVDGLTELIESLAPATAPVARPLVRHAASPSTPGQMQAGRAPDHFTAPAVPLPFTPGGRSSSFSRAATPPPRPQPGTPLPVWALRRALHILSTPPSISTLLPFPCVCVCL